MRDGVHVLPELLAQATELKDRVELGLARRLFQEMSDLLGKGAVLALGALLKLLVEIVREVLDVERRHDCVLHIASIMEDDGHRSQRSSRQRSRWAGSGPSSAPSGEDIRR